jgi:N-acetylneuraminic acid mutarotase
MTGPVTMTRTLRARGPHRRTPPSGGRIRPFQTAGLLLGLLLTVLPAAARAQSPWSLGNDMPTPRYAAAAGLIDGKIYVAGGYHSGYSDTLEAYDVATGIWTPDLTRMNYGRRWAAHGIINGKLYVVGGGAPQLEYYDPIGNTWTVQDTIPTDVQSPASAAVGNVLYVIGGQYSGSYIDSVFAYDAVADTWTRKANMPTARWQAGAAVINGKIYVVGGYNSSGYLATLEIYDPVADSWSSGAPLPIMAGEPVVTTLGGQLYLADYNYSRLYTYDPGQDSWSQRTNLPAADRMMAVESSGERIFYLGGYAASPANTWMSTVRIYDRTLDRWSTLRPLDLGRVDAGSAWLDGKIYIVGGYNNSGGGMRADLDVYDPATGDWTSLAPMDYPRRYSAVVPYRGRLYVLGGSDSDKFEVYDTATNTWTDKSPLPGHWWGAIATEIDGRIYLINESAALGIYDIATDTWTTGPSMPQSVYYGASGTIDGKWYIVGGLATDALAILQIFDPQGGGSWSSGADMNTTRYLHAVVADGGKLYAVGGQTGAGYTDQVEVYTPGGSWSVSEQVALEPISQMTSAIGNGILYMAGGTGSTDTRFMAFRVGDLRGNRLRLTPGVGATGVPKDTDIVIDFDWPVDGSSINTSNISVSLGASPVPGSLQFVPSLNRAVFTPSDTLAGGSTVNVSVSGAVQDTVGIGFDGNNDGTPEGAVTDDFFYSFTVGSNNPVAVIDSVSGLEHPTGVVDVHYTISSPLNNYMETTDWQFSRDHQVWYPIDAPAIGNRAPRLGGSYSITWNTRIGGYNLDHVIDDTVWFRMRVKDSTLYSGFVSSDTLAVDNNMPPAVVSIGPVPGERSGAVPIPYELEDAEGDGLSIRVRYSLDQGMTWRGATVTGDTVNIYPATYSGSITWASGVDAAGVDQPDTWLAILPSDRFIGLADTLKGLWIDNNQPPEIIVSPISGAQSDSVWASYTVTDAEGDTVTVSGEYTLDGGSTWHPATLSGTTVVWPGGYGQTIAWLSHVDEPSLPINLNVGLRLIPTDHDPGPPFLPEPALFGLANNAPPTVDLNIRSALGGEVQIGYRLHDIEENDLSYTVAYSADGTNWSSASITGMMSSIASVEYDSVFTWHSGTDLPGTEGPAHLRVIPSDAFSTGPQEIHSNPVVISLYLDNAAPDTLTATGSGNGNVFEYWFNEAVTRGSAAVPGNINLSGGLTVDSVSVASLRTAGPDMLQPRYRPTVVTLKGYLYVIGGPATEYLVSRFDPATGTWTTLTSTPRYRQLPIAGVIGERIYVVGGGTSYVDYYDPESDSWTTTTHQGSFTGEMSSVGGVIDGKLYMAGGSSSYYALRRYDPVAGSWENLDTLPLGVYDAAGGVVGGKLYIAGGNDGSNNRAELQIYDPVTGWSLGASMPTVLYGASAAVVDDQLYLIGGFTGTQYMDDAYRYDPATDTWTVEPTPWLAGAPDLVFMTGAAELDGLVHVVGGFRFSDSEYSTAHQIIDPAHHFFGHLSPGQSLPGPQTTVTVTASNISDHYGNIAASVDGDFNPTSGDVPSVVLPDIHQGAWVGGDVTVSYQISDTEGNAVSLYPEFSLDTGSTWAPASVSGDTTGILPAAYDGELVWHSGTDAPDEHLVEVWFRVTPRDNDSAVGTAATVHLAIDNRAPQSISATGVGADTVFSFWFDEPVAGSTATDAGNFSLSGDLNVSSIASVGTYTLANPIPTGRQHLGATLHGGKIYAIGGATAPYVFTEYDRATDTWTPRASQSGYRYGRPVILGIGNSLYVAGGGQAELEVYDPVTDDWSYRTAGTTTTAYYAMGGVIDDKFYFVGGSDSATLDLLRVYDPATGNWTDLSPMLTPTYSAASGVIDGKLYVAGGRDDSGYIDKLQIYDPLTNSWSYGADLPTPLGWTTGVAASGRLYVLGGYSSLYGAVDSVYVYDPVSDRWTVGSGSYLPEPMQAGAAVTDGATIYYVSGYGATTGAAVDNLVVIDPFSSFIAHLGASEYLPGPQTAVTVTATGISDRVGNVASSLTTDFNPTTGNVPTVAIPWQYGIFGGDVTIPYQIADDEGNAVTLLAEYSTDGGGSWAPATVTGDTSGILPAQYNGSLVWNSATDLPDQVNPNVGFRLTPWDDPSNHGTPVPIMVGIDNLAPGTLYAEGSGNGDKVTFWFDEQVRGSTARDTTAITFSGGLTAGSVRSIPATQTANGMMYNRDSHALALMDGKIYAVGGYQNPYNFEVFDPATGAWTELTSTNGYHGGGPILGAIGGKLYLLGGGNSNIEIWDPETNSWSYWGFVTNGETTNAAGGVIDDKLYIAGGDVGGLIVDVRSFDPATGTLTDHAGMPTAVHYAAYGVINGKLYVAGGSAAGGWTDVLQIYDPVSDSWSYGASLPTVLYGATGAVFEGRLYVIGGNDNTGYKNYAHIYDPATDTWTVDHSAWLPEPYYYQKAIPLGGRIHVTGGDDLSSNVRNVHLVINPNDRFEATLTAGDVLPGPETQVTMSVQNVEDLYGNVKSSLSTDFYPGTGDVPTVVLGVPASGTQSGDISLYREIHDTEGNAVSLLVEYSVDGGGSWSPATVTGDTTEILPADYNGYLVWKSRTDVPGQKLGQVGIRITPRDNPTTPGVPAAISIRLDNLAPATLSATGHGNGTFVEYWFDEPVSRQQATDPANISLSGGLTADTLYAVVQRQDGPVFSNARLHSASLAFQGFLFIYGGFDAGASLERYDPVTNSWSTLPSSVGGNWDGPLFEQIGGPFYAIGGGNGNLNIYSCATNSWSTGPAGTLTGANNSAGGNIDGRLYMAGGDSGGPIANLRVYDPASNQWTDKTPMPYAVYDAAYAVIDRRLYVAGGWNGSSRTTHLQIYNPDSDSWSLGQDLPGLIGEGAVGVVLDGKLVVIGGYDLGNAYIYDPATDRWTVDPQEWAHGEMVGTAATLLEGRIYVTGGWPAGGDHSENLMSILDVASRYRADLTGGQNLPDPATQVTVTTTDIGDLFGNIAPSLQASFYPTTGEVPSIGLTAPSGTQAGDVPIPFQISDPEGNIVWLTAQYSTDGGATWNPASLTGLVTGITSADYTNSTTWQSGTDLPGQALENVWLKVTPWDNTTTPGTPDSISFPLDNQPPAAVTASGLAGRNIFLFSFDETVDQGAASTTTNLALTGPSGALGIDQVDFIPHWLTANPLNIKRYDGAAFSIGSKVYIVSGWGDGSSPYPESMMEILDTTTGIWEFKSVEANLIGGSATRIGDYVYGVGNTRFYRFDIQAETWTYLENRDDFFFASTGEIDGKLYVAGGYSTTGGVSVSSMRVYDPGSQGWSNFASMHETRAKGAGGVVSGKFVLAGGWRPTGGILATVEVYDPATNVWTYVSPMPQAVADAASWTDGGQLYVAGGEDVSGNQLTTLYRYDLASDHWDLIDNLPVPRSGFDAAVCEGRAYLMGGYVNTTIDNRVDVYNIRAQFQATLSSGQTLSAGLHTFTASNIPDAYGNSAALLSTDFYPDTGEPPSVFVIQPQGTQGGDIEFGFIISDPESNPVTLTVEYSTDGQSSWQTATLDASYVDLPASSYEGTLVWQSRTDLADHLGEVWVRITPADNPTTPGTPTSVSFRLDNKPPTTVTASGLVGEGSFQFGFDEAVDAATATDPANLTLTSGLTVEAVQAALSVREGAALPLARKSAGSTVHKDLLYVIGGYSNGQAVHVYDPVADSWTTKASTQYTHDGPVVGMIGGKIYVVGGYVGGYLEIYDPATNSWTSRTGGTNTHANGMVGGAIGDSLLVAGGMWATVYNTLEFYNTVTQTWTSGPNMLQGVTDAASVIIGRKLYVVGGDTNLLQIYDPAASQWSYGSSLPVSLSAPTGVVVDGKFYCIGGIETGGSARQKAYVYDPDTDVWTPDDRDWLPAPIYDAVAEYIDGTIYFTGGYDQTTYQASARTVIIDPFTTFTAQLSAGQTLPFQNLTLTANNIADLYGNVAPTLTLDWVPQDTNSDPTVDVQDIPDEVSGDVTISYLIADAEGDAIRIEPEYSLDEGNNWLTPTVTGTLADIAAGAYDGSLVWHSATDLPGADSTGVWFRITTFDNTIETGGSDGITLHVDNNQVPTITIDDAVYSRTDSLWTFSYTLSDAESDTLRLDAVYSLDDGSTWYLATTEGRRDTLLAADYVNQIIWRSEIDIPGTVQQLLFQLTPWDHDPGTPVPLTLLHNALGLPTAELSWSWSGEQSGDIVFDYVADDVDLEPLTLHFEYFHPDGNWYQAWITAPGVDNQPQDVHLADPSAYTGSVTWHSATDLAGLDVANAVFRVIPYDASNAGVGSSVTLHVDNNVPPTVTVGTPSVTVARNVTIPVTLSDAEGDTLHYRVMYSLEAASGVWHDATVLNNNTEILTGGYAHNLIWDSMADVGYMHSDLITIQVQPADHDTGPWGLTSAISLANYVGDYTGDIAVDFADFATLVSAWNSQDTYHDIGPATGTVPDLVPVYDGQIDFEDLAVYAMMWTWSDANLPAGATAASAFVAARPVTTWVPGTAGTAERKSVRPEDHPVRLEQPLPDDPWAPDTGILELRLQACEVSGLTAAGLTLEYDVRHLKLREVVPGPMLGTTGGSKPSLVQLKRVRDQEGRIELLLGRIEPERPSVSGSGTLAVVRFEKLTREDSVVRVAYDLRDRQAAEIAGGDYERSVQATLRPTEFSLLQNYPNPFNGETVIRFQLPTEQRVQIQLYNMRGQLVTTLLDERRDAGYHRVSWNGRDAAGRPVASGIYIYLIQAGTNRTSKKLVILR